MNPYRESADKLLQKLRFDQQDLESHAHRPVKLPYELNEINNYYGNGEIIRRYASLPKDEPLLFAIEHFVPLDYKSPHHYDSYSGLPAFLAAHEKRADAYTQLGIHSITAGSGIHYAKQLLKQESSWENPMERHGTIAFPHKSTQYIDRSFDYDAFADWLISLPEEYQPVCVCISWKDYLENKHQAYIERDIPVVGCGNTFNLNFLFRFIDLCSHFQYSCGNAIGSCYPFSVLCGCQYFYKDFGGVSEKENDTVRHLPAPGTASELGAKLKNLAPYPPDPTLLDKQRDLVNFVTGKKHILSPEKIQELFDWSRRQLLQHQGTRHVCTNTSKLSEFNTWLPNHITSDGWSSCDSRIIIKASTQARTLKAYLEFPAWLFEKAQMIQITIGESPAIKYECPPAYYEITLPIDAGKQKSVRIESALEKNLTNEDHRSASFCFLGWEVSNESTNKPKCVPQNHEQLPQFIRDR